MTNNAKTTVLASAIAVTTLAAITVGALLIKDVIEKKRIGGKLIRVNYKFTKEFDD